MRILIDLQGAQTGSRFRGIGRSSIARTKALIRNRGAHEILLLLSGLFQETIAEIRAEFTSLLPAQSIVIFAVPSPASASDPENAWRIEAGELIREWMIDALAPDIVLITSFFEGPTDPGIVSIGRLPAAVKTAVILHDLIPLLNPDAELRDSSHRDWYYLKISALCKADLLLAVSDSARREAIDALGFDGARVVSISSAADERFSGASVSPEAGRALLERFGITRKFVLHVGAPEERKNFDGLIRAFALLPPPIRDEHQLVLVTWDGDRFRHIAANAGLDPQSVVFPGYVTDDELVALYSLCTLFVIPSFHEGFGLPALEAMCCGAAVIGSNATSIPEVIGREEALFDPHSDRSIADAMQRALADAAFRQSLQLHGRERSKRFSWDLSARLTINALQEINESKGTARKPVDVPFLLQKITSIGAGVLPNRTDLTAVADSISMNEAALAGRERTAEDRSLSLPMAVAAGNRAAGQITREINPHGDAFIRNLYRIFHSREADPGGLESYLAALRSGRELHDIVADFLNSEEFALRRSRPTRIALSNGAPPSAPVIEVAHHQVWGPQDQPRIVLLKLDHIGDFVLALDAFHLIRDTWPNAHITLVCGPWNQSIAERLNLFDAILSCEFYADTAGINGRDIASKIAEYRDLPLASYDIAVDLRCYDDNRVLLNYTKAKYRAGYACDGIELDLALPQGHEPGMMAHIGGRTAALAAAVAWTFGTPARKVREALLNGRAPARQFSDGVVVGISPGTRNALRSWSKERFVELARLLYRSGDYRFVLIGGPADRPAAEFIASALPPSAVINLAGATAIGDVPPVFAGLDLFIGGETGTTHIAALMGVPTVCIFSGVTNIASWRPVGPHVVTLRGNVSCSPCFLGTIAECPWSKRCMDIPPVRVAAEAIALVERVGSVAPAEEPGVRDEDGPPEDESAAQFVTGLYEVILDRPPDADGFASNLRALRRGLPPHELVLRFLNSPECDIVLKKKAFNTLTLPDLRSVHPDCYLEENGSILYDARNDERISRMESLIRDCGYYDRFGAWSMVIDEDKKRIAQLVECLGAKSCLEVGCFNAPILSLLKDRGVDVAGVDLSHLAFVVAFSNVRQNLIWGDLLTANITRKFDCIVALDVLEHLNPLVFPKHISRLKALLADEGVAIINSPMFGTDEIFQTVFPQYISEWIATGDRDFFRQWPCDAQGWPIHGHMVMASPKWWEERFLEQGLVRLKQIEAQLQAEFVNYFEWAPARKSLFLLGHEDRAVDSTAIIGAIKRHAW